MKKFFEGFVGCLVSAIVFTILIFFLFVFPLWKGMPTFDSFGSYDGRVFGMPLKEAIVLTVLILIVGFIVFIKYLEDKLNNQKKSINNENKYSESNNLHKEIKIDTITPDGREKLIIKKISLIEDELDNYFNIIRIETVKTKYHKRNDDFINEFVFSANTFEEIVMNGFHISQENIDDFIGATFEYDYKLFSIESKPTDIKFENFEWDGLTLRFNQSVKLSDFARHYRGNLI